MMPIEIPEISPATRCSQKITLRKDIKRKDEAEALETKGAGAKIGERVRADECARQPQIPV